MSQSRRREPSRLQRIAPASLKINPAKVDVNVPIPLLSPLVTSPDRIDFSIYSSSSDSGGNSKGGQRKEEAEKARVAAGVGMGKRWQHPAAPFGYEPATLVPFVCNGGSREVR